jgi:hypothetical protein
MMRRASSSINPGSEPHLDQSVEFERDDGFAHGRARNAEGLRQLALGGQALADFMLAVGDCLRELLRDLFVKASWFGHGTQYPCSSPHQTSNS